MVCPICDYDDGHKPACPEVGGEGFRSARKRVDTLRKEPMTTNQITIYGASDDLIEIEGAISEEFSALGEDDGYLVAVSDGTLLRVRYTRDGVWRIDPIHNGSASLEIVRAIAGDDDNYTDRATLTGDVKWVALATESASR